MEDLSVQYNASQIPLRIIYIRGAVEVPLISIRDMAIIAGNAADAVGVDYGGVDLLRHREGYTVLEVNGTPNWHCMSAPIPELLAEYLISQEREMRT